MMKHLFNRLSHCVLFMIAALVAVLASCSGTEHDIETREDTIVKLEATETFTTFNFTAPTNWTATLETPCSWLTIDTPSGVGGNAKLNLSLLENTSKDARQCVILLKTASYTQRIIVSQAGSLVEKIDPSTIADYDKYYKPREFANMDMLRSDSKWSWFRSKQSQHFFVFWEAGFGADPNSASVPAELRVDIDDLLKKAEQFYTTNITRLGMAEIGKNKSYLDKYKMEIYLLYQTDWLATGSGYDDTIGALWVNPSTCQPVGSVIGHEIGHSFQYQVYCDQVLNGAPNDFKTGFRYGYDGSNGGNGFWEQCAQWQSFQDYPQEYFGGDYGVWAQNCHRHFEHEWMRYASYWLQCYWTEKHGDKTVSSVWKSSKYPYDAIQTYNQLYCGNNWKACADELYDYAAHAATFDIQGPRTYSAAHLNDYSTKFYTVPDGYYQIAYAKCPGNTGFNVIALNPSAGETITADFVGLKAGAALAADDPGEYMESEKVAGRVRNYNSADKAGNEGWRYGFVAYLSDGTRRYSEMFCSDKGTATWSVPAQTEHLYMVVMGASKTYVQSPWDEKETTDAQYPYKVKFSGTDLKGNFDIDENAEPSDVTITLTAKCNASSGEYVQGALDLSANKNLAKAFSLQPSNIAAKLQEVGAEPAEGKIVWACRQSNGSYSYNSTANNGFWCDTNGDNVGWSNGFAYVEFNGLTITYGQYPDKNKAGDKYTLSPTLIYTKGGKKYYATINVNFEF